MKKLIIIGGVLFLAVLIYLSSSDPSKVSDVGGEGEEKDPGVGGKIRSTFRNILPGESNSDLRRHDEDNPHVVVIKPGSSTMSSNEILDRLDTLKGAEEREALDFARWSLFSENANFSNAEKEQFLEKSFEILSPEEAKLLLHHVLLEGNNPALYDKAISIAGQKMTPNELKSWVQDFLSHNPGPEAKSAVIDYSASRNLYIK